MNQQEKNYFEQYRQLHQQFYSAIKNHRSFATIRRIYDQLQDAWQKYVGSMRTK